MNRANAAILSSGIVLLGLLVYSIGPASLWKELRAVGWSIVPLIALEGSADLFHTQGWRHCLLGRHRSLSFARVFCIRMSGSSINYLTPTAGFGGEVAKGMLLWSERAGAEAAAAVIIGKLSYALAQIVFVVIGAAVVLTGAHLPGGLWAGLIAGTALLAAGITGFLIVQRRGKLGSVVRWAVVRRIGGRGLAAIESNISQVDEALKGFYRTRPLDLPLSVLWHTAGMVVGIAPAFYFLAVTTDGPTLSMAASIVVLGTWFNLVTFAVPVDVGVQESVRVIAFRVLGFGSALGLAYGIVLRLEQLFWSGVGLMMYGVLVIRMRQRTAPGNVGGGNDSLRRDATRGDAHGLLGD